MALYYIGLLVNFKRLTDEPSLGETPPEGFLIKKQKTMANIKILTKYEIKKLKEGNTLILHNSNDGEGDLFTLRLGHWGHFALEKNGEITKLTKTIKPILQKLESDNVIAELTQINK
jgi:hypothetical protein